MWGFLLFSFFALLPNISYGQAVLIEAGGYLYLQSNGIPPHETGRFPNKENPYALRKKNLEFRVTKKPKPSGTITWINGHIFGISLSGAPFDPYTDKCFEPPIPSKKSKNTCRWRYETLTNKKKFFGLDSQNGHVDETGSYHYHGYASRLISNNKTENIVGYAADGYPVYQMPWSSYKSSYQLKEGKRSRRKTSPGGEYDGTYEDDYEFVPGSGDLDECNGLVEPDTLTYRYYITKTYPFIPRCWKGTPDPSFLRRGAGKVDAEIPDDFVPLGHQQRF